MIVTVKLGRFPGLWQDWWLGEEAQAELAGSSVHTVTVYYSSAGEGC